MLHPKLHFLCKLWGWTCPPRGGVNERMTIHRKLWRFSNRFVSHVAAVSPYQPLKLAAGKIGVKSA